MTKTVEEKYLERMRIILCDLSHRTASRIDLQIRFIKKADARWSFDRTFSFLIKDGRIEKCDSAKRSPYCITERGRKLLECLS